jgi:hypothetical protein
VAAPRRDGLVLDPTEPGFAELPLERDRIRKAVRHAGEEPRRITGVERDDRLVRKSSHVVRVQPVPDVEEVLAAGLQDAPRLAERGRPEWREPQRDQRSVVQVGDGTVLRGELADLVLQVRVEAPAALVGLDLEADADLHGPTVAGVERRLTRARRDDQLEPMVTPTLRRGSAVAVAGMLAAVGAACGGAGGRADGAQQPAPPPSASGAAPTDGGSAAPADAGVCSLEASQVSRGREHILVSRHDSVLAVRP